MAFGQGEDDYDRVVRQRYLHSQRLSNWDVFLKVLLRPLGFKLSHKFYGKRVWKR